MKVSLKTFLPIVAIGSMALASCSSPSSRAQKYMEDRPREEFLNITNSDDRALVQSRLDSLAYRDIFNGTNAAKDSAKVAEFNKIASEMRPSFSSASKPVSYCDEIGNILVNKGITNKEYKNFPGYNRLYSNYWNVENCQHFADDWAYRKFFSKIGIMNEKLNAKCDSISKLIRPQ